MMNRSKISKPVSYSCCSYYLESYFKDILLSNATCFVVFGNRCDFLVSNWHVFSGRNAETNEVLSKYAAIPNKIKVYFPFIFEEQQKIAWGDPVEYCLCDDNQIYYEEMVYGDVLIDVSILPIKKEINRYYTINRGEQPFNDDTKYDITDPVYIIGYPFGRIAGNLPIWKVGFIASEPNLEINSHPYFYIDTATRQGMSGSPVVFYKSRSVNIVDKLPNLKGVDFKTKYPDFSDINISDKYTKNIGIYSGRLPKDYGEGDAQIGRVWRFSYINEIINRYNVRMNYI